MPMLLAALVGFWSLAAQFVFNRIIFFYVANSEYAAATIISLHLSGFLVGSALGRRFKAPLIALVTSALAAMALAQVTVWTLGVAVFGFVGTILFAMIFAFVQALLAGFIVVRLIETLPPRKASPVIIADSLGSVAGALVGGFLLIPLVGLHKAFAAVLALQLLGLLSLLPRRRLAVVGGVCTVALVAFFVVGRAREGTATMPKVDGLSLFETVAKQDIVFERRSPFGTVSVVEMNGEIGLNIDNRSLCGIFSNSPAERRQSEWVMAVEGVKLLNGEAPYVVNVGLGCGTTLAALLQSLPPSATVEMVELNTVMPEAQKVFRPRQPFGLDDPRAKLTISDGFAHFLNAPAGPQYDAVMIDVAWMQNMNATHLFSQKMYQNISWRLKPGGLVVVWSEEINPFSEVSLIMYKTLKSVFPHVAVDGGLDTVIFYAALDRDVSAAVQGRNKDLAHWMDLAAAESPVNTLDDLAMNRHKFTVWGDSTYERLRLKYTPTKGAQRDP